mmetsp:Transcript_8696/g.20874  ORF Transcript_8696/g.20874 Transcript_8696/m.20874 type:complete len:319 (+) Transcript_8696:203-1159(+)
MRRRRRCSTSVESVVRSIRTISELRRCAWMSRMSPDCAFLWHAGMCHWALPCIAWARLVFFAPRRGHIGHTSSKLIPKRICTASAAASECRKRGHLFGCQLEIENVEILLKMRSRARLCREASARVCDVPESHLRGALAILFADVGARVLCNARAQQLAQRAPRLNKHSALAVVLEHRCRAAAGLVVARKAHTVRQLVDGRHGPLHRQHHIKLLRVVVGYRKRTRQLCSLHLLEGLPLPPQRVLVRTRIVQHDHVDVVDAAHRKGLHILGASTRRECLCVGEAPHTVGEHRATDEELLSRDAGCFDSARETALVSSQH